MNIHKLRKLVNLIQESNISEIEIKEGESSVKISKASANSAPIVNHYQESAINTTNKQAEPVIVHNSQPKETPEDTQNVIRSPMVGTVYLTPSPGAKPYVTVGQEVKNGDTLCLIEAMKMFNQIEVDRHGTITKILVENSVPIEFNQPLFIIE